MSEHFKAVVRRLGNEEVIEPEDGINVFPNSAGHLEHVKDIRPKLINLRAGQIDKPVYRIVKHFEIDYQI